MIIRVFNENPRQIIQFINLLLSNYLLLKEFCENNSFEDNNFYRDNIPQLAKFLLLKQRHPKILAEYQKSNTYNLYEKDFISKHDDPAFQLLLTQTEDITISSLEPFFKYRISKDEQALPGISKLINMMLNDDEKFEAYAKEIGVENNAASFSKVIANALNGISNPLQKFKLINHFLHLASIFKLSIHQSLRKIIIKVCTSEVVNENILRIDPEFLQRHLFDKPSPLTSNERKTILKNYIAPISSQDKSPVCTKETLSKLYLLVATEKAHLDENSLKTLRRHIANDFDDPAVQQLFVYDHDNQAKFINSTFKNNALDKYKSEISEFPKLVIYLELFAQFRPLDTNYIFLIEAFEEKWQYLLSQDISTENQTDFQKIIIILRETLIISRNATATDEQLKLNNQILQKTKQFIENNLHLANLTDFISLIKITYSLNNPSKIAYDFLIKVLKSSSPQSITLFTSIENAIDLVVENESLAEVFIETFIENKALEKFSKEKLSADFIFKILLKQIKNGLFVQNLDYLHEYRDLLTDIQITSLITTLLARIESIADNNESEYLKDCVKCILFLADNSREKLSELELWDLLSDILLHHDELEFQELTYKEIKENIDLFESKKASEIGEKIIDNILDNDRINEYFIIESAMLFFDYLSEEIIEKYHIFLFERALARTDSVNVLIACEAAIKKLNSRIINEQIQAIDNFVSEVEYTDNEDPKSANYSSILLFLSKKLKSNKSVEAQELKNRINVVIKAMN